MVDIHCHILPALDDGARSWEIAIEMCRMATQDGIRHIVATPHANSRFHYDREQFEATLKELSARINGCPELSLGCDFRLSYENFLEILKQPRDFTIGATPYLLVELDDFSVPSSVSRNLETLIAHGLVPVITHPERNPILRGELHRVLEWVEQGSLVQITAGSLDGRWGIDAQTACEWLLKRNAVHVIATDAHNTGSRPPILSKAKLQAEHIVGEIAAAALVCDNPSAIVKGEQLPYRPPVARK